MKLIASMALFFLVATTSLAQNPALTTGLQSPSKINLNQASVANLTHAIKGIGIKRAAAIVQYRQEHGPFKSLHDLALVHGLSKQFVKKHWTALQATFIY